jgi:hypothetical protein
VSLGRARRARRIGTLARLCCGAVAIGCAAPPEPARRAEAPAAAASGELDGRFGSVEATGQGLELDLPDAEGWRRDPRDQRSFVAVHAGTSSRLLVRTWRADSTVRPEDCECELRQLRPELPALTPEERVEERSSSVAGYAAARLVAGVVPSLESAGVLDGYALLFGSDGRRCLALIYSTSAQGEAAPRIIGERLAAMTRISFERARRLGIDQRVRVPRR